MWRGVSITSLRVMVTLAVGPRMFEFLTMLTFGALRRNHIVSTEFETIAKKKEGSSSMCDQQRIMNCLDNNRSWKGSASVLASMLCGVMMRCYLYDGCPSTNATCNWGFISLLQFYLMQKPVLYKTIQKMITDLINSKENGSRQIHCRFRQGGTVLPNTSSVSIPARSSRPSARWGSRHRYCSQLSGRLWHAVGLHALLMNFIKACVLMVSFWHLGGGHGSSQPGQKRVLPPTSCRLCFDLAVRVGRSTFTDSGHRCSG